MEALRRPRAALARWLDRHGASESAIMMFTALVVGIGAGLGVILFRRLTRLVQDFAYGDPAAEAIPAYVFLVVPAVGGAIVGALYYWLTREARGHGVPEVMEAAALRGGRIRPRVTIVKSLASVVCIGTGGSAGNVGPVVLIGSGFGSVVGQVLRLSDERVRTLLACGAAGGIAAMFNAPIAGAIFAIEVILGRLHTFYFGAVVISAVTASVVAQPFGTEAHAFMVPEYSLVSPWELAFYTLLGVAAALLSVGFSRGLYLVKDFRDRVPVPEWIKPAIGGLLLGVIGLLTLKENGFPMVFGVGFDIINEALLGELVLGATLGLFAAKMLATWVTLGSGGSGGVFAPSLFLGAMLGATFGSVANQLFPDITAPAGAYALVGAAAFFAGAAHAPVTAILIVFEMTGDYRIILPLMLATVMSTVLSSLLSHDSIYTLKLSRRGVHLERGRDVDVLETIRVGDVMSKDVVIVSPAMSARRLSDEFTRTHISAFPIVDAEDELTGMVSIEDLNHAVAEKAVEDLTVADVAPHGEVFVAYPDESMGTALRRLGIRDVSRLPVLEAAGSRRVVGVIGRKDIVRAYNNAIARRGRDPLVAEEFDPLDSGTVMPKMPEVDDQ